MIPTLLLFAFVLVIVIGSLQSSVPFPTKFRDFLRSPVPMIAEDVKAFKNSDERAHIFNRAAVIARINARAGR